MTKEEDLKQRIIKEMAVEYRDVLEKSFDLAKQFVRITKNGKVEIPVKDKLAGKDCILLYLVGKLYAKEAGLSPSETVNNSELMVELGIPQGSVLPWLMELRKKPGIRQMKEGKQVAHYIPIHLVEPVLKMIDKKLKKVA
jgi:hypothetical protein